MTYNKHTALIVVDVQNDFAHPDGSLYVAGGEAVVAAANEEIKKATQAESFIVFTQDWHPPQTPHFAPEGLWPVHCVRDTWGAELHDGLVASGPIVKKGANGEDGYSGFSVRDNDGIEHETRLANLLIDEKIKRVVIVGIAYDVCVKETALDSALTYAFETYVLRDVTAAVYPENSSEVDRVLQEAGVKLI